MAMMRVRLIIPILGLLSIGMMVVLSCAPPPVSVTMPAPTQADAIVAQWQRRRSMLEARSWIGMASVGDKIYAVGGMVGAQGDRLNSVEVYDLLKNEWRYVAPMPTARSSPATVAVGSQIFAIGGFPATGTTTVVEVYDTQSDQWRTGFAPMPTKRFDLAVAVIGANIYTFGGYDTKAMNVSEIYDTVNNRWSSAPSLPTARYALQAVVVDGKIWVMGGHRSEQGPTAVIEIFDPATQTWSRGPALPEPLAGFGATMAEGKLHIAKYDEHFQYDFETGRWSRLSPMLTSRHGLQLTYIAGWLYAVGGCMPGEGNLFDVAKNEAYPIRAAASAQPQPAPLQPTPSPSVSIVGAMELIVVVVILLCAAWALPRLAKDIKLR
jgi:hypothetical protein